MRYLKQEERKRNPLLIPLIVVSCLAIVLLALLLWQTFGGNESGNGDTMQEQENPAAEQTEASEEDETISVTEETVPVETTAPNEENMIKIETPYGVLMYPKTWEAYVSYEETEWEDAFAVTFYCTMKEQKIELFSAMFNDENIGTLIGFITVDEAEVPFTISSTQFIPDDTWTEEEKMIFNEMLNDINVTIRCVTSNETFIEGY